MNKKISDLAAISSLSGAELLEILQGGVNKKGTILDLIALAGTSSFVDQEVPTGLINSSNVTYTLANTPIAGSVHVYLNGIRMKTTGDYSISGTTITFVSAPQTGDTLIADYRR